MKTIPTNEVWVVTHSASGDTSICDHVIYLIEDAAKAKLAERRASQEAGHMTALYYEVMTLEQYISEVRSEARDAGYNSASYQ